MIAIYFYDRKNNENDRGEISYNIKSWTIVTALIQYEMKDCDLTHVLVTGNF